MPARHLFFKTIVLAIVLLAGYVILTAIIVGDAPAPLAAPPAASFGGSHQGMVEASLYGCEQFAKGSSPLEVKSVLDSYELSGKKLKDPLIEAWVQVRYRAGADGRLMTASCHYAQFGKDIVLIDHEFR